MEKIILGALAIALSGCVTTQAPTLKKIHFVEKKVPVFVCPPPTVVPVQKLSIDKLHKVSSNNYDAIAKSYAETIEQLQSENQELRSVIKYYDKISENYEEIKFKTGNLNKLLNSAK
jgi:hypothetical protein